MTPRRADYSLHALRIGAFLAAWALALASPADVQAGCAGPAHRVGDPSMDVLGLSPEVLAATIADQVADGGPLKPTGCSGAFCSRPYSTPGADLGGGVDVRAGLWAIAFDRADLLGSGEPRILAPVEELRPILHRDFIFHPPR